MNRLALLLTLLLGSPNGFADQPRPLARARDSRGGVRAAATRRTRDNDIGLAASRGRGASARTIASREVPALSSSPCPSQTPVSWAGLRPSDPLPAAGLASSAASARAPPAA